MFDKYDIIIKQFFVKSVFPTIFRDELYQIILSTLRGIFSFDFWFSIEINVSV